MAETEVAAFMPVLNEDETIHKSINSLEEQTKQISKLIVVDGGSTDETHEIVEQKSSETDFEIDLEVLEGSGVRHSSEYGANQAADYLDEKECSGIILRIEGDSSLEENFVEEACRYLEKEPYKVFGAQVKPHNRNSKKVTRKLFKILQNADGLPKGRAMAFKPEDFYKVNGYKMKEDEDIKKSEIDCLEDSILVSKLKKEGKIAFSEETHVKSTLPSTTATSIDRWKKGVKIEAKIGPTGYGTKIINPLNPLLYSVEKALNKPAGSLRPSPRKIKRK